MEDYAARKLRSRQIRRFAASDNRKRNFHSRLVYRMWRLHDALAGLILAFDLSLTRGSLLVPDGRQLADCGLVHQARNLAFLKALA